MNRSQDKPLTILSQTPESIWSRRPVRGVRQRIRSVLKATPRPKPNPVRGPASVERNLLAGLRRIGQSFRLNPTESAVTPWVGVLSDPNGALPWAIRAKRSGPIERLVAGPNLVVVPDEYDRILTDPAIDLVITPCKWVSDFYAQIAPNLIGRLAEWPVGVDEDYWCPDPNSAGKIVDFLIYDKIGQAQNRLLVPAVLQELAQRGLTFETLSYGDYDLAHYRYLLRTSRAMIYLTESESQGIALFEAWACDIPTLVWDRQLLEWKGYCMTGASSAPYLGPDCGLSFRDLTGLPGRLDKFEASLSAFRPREFILRRFTLAQAAQAYVRLYRGEPC